VSDHFNGNEFFNQDTSDRMGSLWKVAFWLLTREEGSWPAYQFVGYGEKPERRIDDRIRATYINHSTFLIQVDGLNILTDPVWSDKIGPVAWPAQSRTLNPGIQFDSLPDIDIVLISHNHYDHMDLPTLHKLKEKFNPVIITPLGNKQTLNEEGINNIIETDWWDTCSANGLNVTTVPARHFSMRGLQDRNTSLWAGFVLHSSQGNIYFAGDTGFGIHFEQIKKKFGPMKLSFIPIGPIHPRDFMAPMHLGPEDAVMAHNILESENSIAMHFGTFSQAEDSQYEAVDLLVKARSQNSNQSGKFLIPFNGKYFDFK